MTFHYDCQFHCSKSSLCSSHVNDARYTILAFFRSWDSRPLFLSLSLSYGCFSHQNILPRTTSPRRIFSTWITVSFSVTGEEGGSPFLYTTRPVCLSFHISEWGIFNIVYNSSKRPLISFSSSFLRYLAANRTRDSEFKMTSAVKKRATQQHQSSQYSHMARRTGSDKCRNNLH